MTIRTCSIPFTIVSMLPSWSSEVRSHVEVRSPSSMTLFGAAQRDVGRVVAFGMGSRCPEPESVSEMGESLLDCHALALARRAFIQ